MKFLVFILLPTICAISMHHMSYNHEKISILLFEIHLRFGSRNIAGNNAMQWNPNRFQNRIKGENKKWFWFRKHIAFWPFYWIDRNSILMDVSMMNFRSNEINCKAKHENHLTCYFSGLVHPNSPNSSIA